MALLLLVAPVGAAQGPIAAASEPRRVAAAPDGPSATRTCAGVHFPAALDVDTRRLQLNGIGLREVTPFGVDVYVAALYAERPIRSADALLGPLPRARLDVRFVRDVGRDRLTGSFGDEIPLASPGDPRLRADVERLNHFMVDMRAGDTMTFDLVPDVGVVVTMRGEARGTIAGATFARAFFVHWIGDRPPSIAFRDGLLGGACD